MLELNHLLQDRKIKIRLDEKAKTALGEEGYDPTFGARPLKRVIEKRIKNGLAMEILQGKIHDGDDIVVGFVNGGYVFTTA